MARRDHTAGAVDHRTVQRMFHCRRQAAQCPDGRLRVCIQRDQIGKIQVFFPFRHVQAAGFPRNQPYKVLDRAALPFAAPIAPVVCRKAPAAPEQDKAAAPFFVQRGNRTFCSLIDHAVRRLRLPSALLQIRKQAKHHTAAGISRRKAVFLQPRGIFLRFSRARQQRRHHAERPR